MDPKSESDVFWAMSPEERTDIREAFKNAWQLDIIRRSPCFF